MTKLIINCETGEIVERELNKAEKDKQKIDEAEIVALKVEAEARAEARQAILDRLGLTADEAKLLLG
jgi:hypothetical protein